MKWCLALLAIALTQGVVCAQATPSPWPGLDPKAARSRTVFVLDDTGTETAGKVLRLDPEAIVLMVDGVERRFEAARVKRIDTRDSLRNGLVIGAVFGVATGLLGTGLADCPGANASGPCPGFRTAGVIVATGFYAAVGAGIDALVKGRKTSYVAPMTSQSPAPGQGRQIALEMRVRW